MITRLSEVWPDAERTARDAGAAFVGASGLADEHAELFAEWIAAGRHGSMKYLQKNLPVRTNPLARFDWAKSAIVILVPYASERPAAAANALSNHIARYALGDDYHEVLDRMLREVESAIGSEVKTWRSVDTGPLSDRALAAQAGLGWIGRNGMLINEERGSYFFIGVLLTSLENDISSELVGDRCGACTRCVDACPTHAILPNRTVDSNQCISYATIEHRGALPDSVARHLEGNAFGCDSCQEVCAWNEVPMEPHPAFVAREQYRATPVTDLLKMAQADFSALFRKSAIKRARLDGMKRNVEALNGQLERAADDRGVDGAVQILPHG